MIMKIPGNLDFLGDVRTRYALADRRLRHGGCTRIFVFTRVLRARRSSMLPSAARCRLIALNVVSTNVQFVIHAVIHLIVQAVRCLYHSWRGVRVRVCEFAIFTVRAVFHFIAIYQREISVSSIRSSFGSRE